MSDIQTMLILEQLPLTVAAEFEGGKWAGFESLVAIVAAINHVQLGGEAQMLVTCTNFEEDDAFLDNTMNKCKKSLEKIAKATISKKEVSVVARLRDPRLAVFTIKPREETENKKPATA